MGLMGLMPGPWLAGPCAHNRHRSAHTCIYVSKSCPGADIESAIDWWMDAFLPLGALPPARLQAAINAAYTSAEEQDGSAMAAEAVLAAAPEAEAEVIRAELGRIKLSGED